MDAAYEDGKADGFSGKRRNPGLMPKYLRWAYEAGYKEGSKDLKGFARRVEQMTQGPGELR